MEEDIKNIQNEFWRCYKEFIKDKDMNKYNKNIQELINMYKDNKLLLLFCQDIAFAWAPVINNLNGST